MTFSKNVIFSTAYNAKMNGRMHAPNQYRIHTKFIFLLNDSHTKNSKMLNLLNGNIFFVFQQKKHSRNISYKLRNDANEWTSNERKWYHFKLQCIGWHICASSSHHFHFITIIIIITHFLFTFDSIASRTKPSTLTLCRAKHALCFWNLAKSLRHSNRNE